MQVLRLPVTRNALPAFAVLLAVGVGCGMGAPRPDPSRVTAPAPDAVDVSLYLVGDAGAPAPGVEPVLQALATDLASWDTEKVVVFLGDNIYPRGLPAASSSSRGESENALNRQLDVLRADQVSGIFVPGNHDWDHSGADGWNAIRRQADHIDTYAGDLATMLPRGGCPGPAVRDIGQRVRLLLLDTQWWLHSEAKPTHPHSRCPADSEAEVTTALREALRTSGNRVAVVVAHHPLRTAGSHGGYFDWDQHIFPLRELNEWLWVPLPVIGSIYPLARNLGVSPQDLSSALNRRLRDSLRAAFTDVPPLVYAAGHEHSLQVILGEREAYALVSGAGVFGHTSPVDCPEDWLFCAGDAGYMRIDFMHNGRNRLAVLAVSREGEQSEVFSMFLDAPPPDTGNEFAGAAINGMQFDDR